MGWKRKWAKDTVKALLPLGDQLRALKRRVIPYPVAPANDELTLEQGLEQVRLVGQTIGPLKGRVVLELGVGWYPTIPLLFRAAGAERVILADLERLLDARTFSNAANFLNTRAATVAEALGLPLDEVRQSLTFGAGSTLDQLLVQANMEYRVPLELEGLTTDTVDVITSRAVLEHFAPESLESLLVSFERVLKPDAVMCHIIDNSDPWQHHDASISPVNFLRYDDSVMWALGLNPQNYRNRLRHSEYLELFERSGYEVVEERGIVDEAALKALETLPLCKQYENTPHEELAKLTSYILVQNARALVLQSLRGTALQQAIPR